MRRNSTLDIYITEICNLNCEYCYVDLKKKEYDGFDYKEFTKRINLLDYDYVKFLWWEPLLKYKDIKNIIISVLSKKENAKFSIITNWLLIDEEKLKFFRKNNTSVTISLHKKWLKIILNKDFLITLLKFKEIIWFVILYDYDDITFWTKLFKLLVKTWFRNFSITPIANISRSNNLLEKLEIELNKIKELIKVNKEIEISETNAEYLKNINKEKFCKKDQADKIGNKKLCTRFDKEYILNDKKNIDNIYELYDKYNSCSSCSDRWFCACPIWWYLDNKDLASEEKVVKIFHKLNKVFIKFYKDVVKVKNIKNFLTEDLNEIRFNLTEQCNLRCNYCYLKFQNKVLDLDEWKNIIDFFIAQKWNKKIISFFWWEPLLEFELLKNLVAYTHKKVKELWKNISYKIATNWLLLNKERVDFLKNNNFEIHLSFNWVKKINNETRDNSYDKLIKKIDLLNNYENLVILMVIFPKYILKIKDSIKEIKELWLNKISFEVYLWNKYKWENKEYIELERELDIIKKSWEVNDIELMNLNSFSNKYLDISTTWKINDNSLEFFDKTIDFNPKKELDKILNKIFNDKK